MPGPPRKDPARRQRRNRVPDLTVIDGAAPPTKTPACPSGFLKITQQLWASFWQSPVASIVRPEADYSALRRLFTLYDERAYQGFRKERIVSGSQGQPVLNPLGKTMQGYDAEIRNLENRFGLSPRSRLALSEQFIESNTAAANFKRTLGDLNTSLEADVELE